MFNLIGICRKSLKRNGYYKEADEMTKRVTSSHSYEDALQIMMEYVNPVSNIDIDDDFDIGI